MHAHPADSSTALLQLIHGGFVHLPFRAAEQIESDLIIYKLYELLLLFMGYFVHLLQNPTPSARFFESGCQAPVIAGAMRRTDTDNVGQSLYESVPPGP
jgi:hypothetical protein